MDALLIKIVIGVFIAIAWIASNLWGRQRRPQKRLRRLCRPRTP